MTWSEITADQLIVGNPQGQHIYIGPGDALGNEGIFLYGPDGVTVLAAISAALASGYFKAKTLDLPVSGGDTDGYIAGRAADIVINGPQSSPTAPQVPNIVIQDDANAGILLTADTVSIGSMTAGHPAALTLIGPGSNATATAFTANGFRSAHASRPGTSDNFTGGVMTQLAQVALPAAAPAGTYWVALVCPLQSSAAATAIYRLIAPNGSDLTGDDSQALDTAARRYPYSWAGAYQHIGGAGNFTMSAQVSAGTGTVWNAPFRLDVTYIGS